MSDELKPCPFCGAVPTAHHIYNRGDREFVRCPTCLAHGPWVNINNTCPIAAWNRRADTKEEQP